MKPLAHLREWAGAAEDVAELSRLRDDEFDPTSETRFEVGARMAELLESWADRIEQSGVVRAFSSSLVTPAGLRAEAAAYREGRDPHE